jgi:hypothetical protein
MAGCGDEQTVGGRTDLRRDAAQFNAAQFDAARFDDAFEYDEHSGSVDRGYSGHCAASVCTGSNARVLAICRRGFDGRGFDGHQPNAQSRNRHGAG